MTVRPGSHMYNLLRLISVSGEFPSRSLGLLGDTRTVKAMVHKMEAVQSLRLSSDGTILNTRLFQVSGKGAFRTVRLNKGALSVLGELHPNAHQYYLSSFPDNKFSGNISHIQRNHRVAEGIAMNMMAGIEIAPYKLPELQKDSIRRVIPETPSYYIARNLKKIYAAELNKTMFTRVIGLLLYPGGSYAVYNTRDAVMKWSGMGELKARQEFSEIVRMNAELSEVTSAVLLGASGQTALQTLLESDKTRRRQSRFDRIYRSVHYIPMDANGISLLKILTLPDWHEKLMSALFSSEMRPTGYGAIEYDAYWEQRYFYSHLDGDIARLIRFGEALKTVDLPFDVLCFPWQVEFLSEYLGGAVRLKQLDMPAVLSALGIK